MVKGPFNYWKSCQIWLRKAVHFTWINSFNSLGLFEKICAFIEIVLALGYNGIDKRLPANEIEHSQTTRKKRKKKRKRKQSTHNILASHRAHLWTFSSTSHRTHRVKTSKRIHIEHIESYQEKKKNNALTTKKKGKIEREYSQIETVQLGYFFSYREAVEVEVEEKWRRR